MAINKKNKNWVYGGGTAVVVLLALALFAGRDIKLESRSFKAAVTTPPNVACPNLIQDVETSNNGGAGAVIIGQHCVTGLNSHDNNGPGVILHEGAPPAKP